ncbi:hypothetical protein [Methylicorpusculum sp.]|uniref:hypothetical protein n=1 Tax=Methylicorpusculum sp. TaxID=2713644 RepID=UPI00272F77D4|nr:hypothetical protein [Methylicorpusculum sp.]MDP2180683.1 hypothetical protein [Methylicorpusculum sp.]MDP3529261.1 hypothetical protein [Methylicorpusculum sp.]MDZ4153136.1 hypothetical protein [Methylicorpusculum sp.]
MTLSGLIVMIGSYLLVAVLMIFCFFRVLTNPKSVLKEHAPMDIDTQDEDPPLD